MTDEQDIYDEKDREEQVADGEISPEEAGFVQGEEEAAYSEETDEEE
jgi:hypothetical protein